MATSGAPVPAVAAGGFDPRAAADVATHGFDLGEKFRRHGTRDRRGDHVERACAHRFKNLAGLRPGVGAHEQDRAGRVGHDVPGGFHAVHAGHDEVHQEQVGAVLGATAHGFRAVARHPGDLVPCHARSVAREQRAAQCFDGDGQVVGDGNFHSSAPPMRSDTACSRVSSWKLLFVK